MSGEGLIHNLLMALIVMICGGILYMMGRYFFTREGVPGIAMTIWNGLFILVGGIVLINFLMSLAGHPLVRW